MFRSIWQYILNNIFKIDTQTTTLEVDKNTEYAEEYESIDGINFAAIFSNKLANYTMNDSTLNIDGKNKRVELLNKTGQSIWRNMKKIVAMAFGYGGICIVPYVKGGKEYYSLVPQDRITIDSMDGDLITGMTILAEKKTVTENKKEKIYLRWTHYQIKNGMEEIKQSYTGQEGEPVATPEFWKDIQEVRNITNVDRVSLCFIKSPINNRDAMDKYGVPIIYGCDDTIEEIKETMKQMQREYKLKETFVGVDKLMFGKDGMPNSGLFKMVDSGKDDFFTVYDPAFRNYTERLQELFRRLEHQIGTSAGIVSELNTQNATATEIKRAMYDTFTIVDDMRANIEKAMDDLFYSMNVLANAYNLTPQGEYELNFDWDYSLLEDSAEQFDQMVSGVSLGVISKPELRNWLKPSETLKESEKAIEEIEKETMESAKLMQQNQLEMQQLQEENEEV